MLLNGLSTRESGFPRTGKVGYGSSGMMTSKGKKILREDILTHTRHIAPRIQRMYADLAIVENAHVDDTTKLATLHEMEVLAQEIMNVVQKIKQK
jgi:hypothetical protein